MQILTFHSAARESFSHRKEGHDNNLSTGFFLQLLFVQEKCGYLGGCVRSPTAESDGCGEGRRMITSASSHGFFLGIISTHGYCWEKSTATCRTGTANGVAGGVQALCLWLWQSCQAVAKLCQSPRAGSGDHAGGKILLAGVWRGTCPLASARLDT